MGDVNEKHCDEKYETKRITYDMDNNDDNEDSSYDFAKSRNPWYGSAFFHWLVFDVIG